RDLHDRGGVRRTPGSGDPYIASDELDTLVGQPSLAWLAERAIDALPTDLAQLARTCAVLGPRFNFDDVAAIDPHAAHLPALVAAPAADLAALATSLLAPPAAVADAIVALDRAE